MGERDEDGSGLPRRSRGSRDLRESSSRRNPDTREASDTPSRHSNARTVADVAASLDTDPVPVETDSVVARLVGIPRVALEEFVYQHQLDRSHDDTQTRPMALFDIENTGNSRLRWKATQTTFVGDDDYTYRPAHLSLDPARLGPGCHTRSVDIDPGRKARVVTLVEELPTGVDIVEVVHPLSVPGRAGTERLVFGLG